MQRKAMPPQTNAQRNAQTITTPLLRTPPRMIPAQA
jgi:hypothetical protein